jgi:hypothetical protein
MQAVAEESDRLSAEALQPFEFTGGFKGNRRVLSIWLSLRLRRPARSSAAQLV